ncbi:MAG: hypothetical protein JJ850_08895 [Kordiimonadaceae bacterium]|nr:hypothetical protein [Kordiimonadaceae bacterium]MBO6569245.1 hypothetical protein [Kordiimonadaceae bacterium]MBO6964721.1 hypothetical protein [Kordiimonadaceae bacterium]
MSSPVKYTFDQAFDGGAKTRYDLEIERLVQQGEDSRKEALAQGIAEGRAQALQEIENATKDAILQLNQSAQALFDQRQALESSLKQEMVHLAYAISSKLAGALIRTKPTAEVQALIEDCLATVSREPRLVVRVSEKISDSIAGQLDAMKNATSFAGDIVLLGEPNMGDLDCRVEWPDGGSERKQDALQHQIEDAVQRFVLSELEDAAPEPAAASEQTAAPA